MPNYNIAHRYSKSLLQLAIEKGILEEVHNDMQLIVRVNMQNRDFANMLINPVINQHKKLTILKAVFKNSLNKLTISLFEILSRRNRANILPELAHAFHEQYNEYKEITSATVITDYPIDDQERKQFIALVKNKTGAKAVELKEQLDPGLVGGFILRVGNQQIDSSLRTKLKELKIEFES